MNLYGRNYVIEHCVSEYLKRREEKLYRIYVTDALKAIAENTTHYLGANEVIDYGSSLSTRWIDVLEPPQPIKEDNRSCKEIVHGIWNRMRNEHDSI